MGSQREIHKAKYRIVELPVMKRTERHLNILRPKGTELYVGE